MSTKNSSPSMWKTKIVCTLGPASSNRETLSKMIVAGMDVVRLNFSHGTHEQHKKTFDLVREIAAEFDEQVSIMCDIQGPKIRTGRMESAFTLNIDDTVRVTEEKIVGTSERFQIKYPNLVGDLKPGDFIFINDGIVKLEITGVDGPDLVCKVLASGTVSDHKGCNIPSGNLSIEVVTPKDEEDLAFIATLDPEYVAASFVGCGNDVKKVKNFLAKHGNTKIKVISKVERPVAVENLDEIIAESDALMVARGDLGVEIPAYDVPRVQKEMIKKCNKETKPVIVATQMLESMCQNARPTRAEANDVYNAVLDGADCVMLSGESSVGKYPVEAVKCMDEIVSVAEQHLPHRDPDDFDSSAQAVTETLAHACRSVCGEFKDLGYSGKVIVLSESGRTARLVSKYRPHLPILCVTPCLRGARELNMVWGVRSVYAPDITLNSPLETRIVKAIELLSSKKLIEEDDKRVVVVSASNWPGAGVVTGVYDVEFALRLAKEQK